MSEQHIWMYGFGGDWDELTHKTGKLHFCWDGTRAWTVSQSGGCSGSDPIGGWDWRVDSCVLTNVDNGGPEVYRTGKGSYHCHPPAVFPCSRSHPTDGYPHTLTDHEYGTMTGRSSCAFLVGGLIVNGTKREILSGCK